jgi:hypothetical protein
MLASADGEDLTCLYADDLHYNNPITSSVVKWNTNPNLCLAENTRPHENHKFDPLTPKANCDCPDDHPHCRTPCPKNNTTCHDGEVFSVLQLHGHLVSKRQEAVLLEQTAALLYGARFFGGNPRSRMPLSFTALLRLKRYQACDQRHSSRVFTLLTGSHCKLRPNTAGEH